MNDALALQLQSIIDEQQAITARAIEHAHSSQPLAQAYSQGREEGIRIERERILAMLSALGLQRLSNIRLSRLIRDIEVGWRE